MERKTINLNEINMTYYLIGKGKPLLFLHGGRVNALTFKKNIELLAKTYTVIAPDIPGYGDSSTPEGIWSFKDYAVFFDEFLKMENLTDVTVVGYSMGGGIAINLAAISKKIISLILVDPAGVTQKKESITHDIKRLLFYVTHPQYFFYLLILLKDYIHYLKKHLFTKRHISKIRDNCAQTLFTSFERITIPTHILWGRSDWIFPISKGLVLSKNIPHTKFTSVEGNHDWFLYNPEMFIEKFTTYSK